MEDNKIQAGDVVKLKSAAVPTLTAVEITGSRVDCAYFWEREFKTISLPLVAVEKA